MDERLLEMLRCPVTKAPLEALSREWLDRLNEAIRLGRVRYADGTSVDEPLAEGLITEDGTMVYRVDDGIPVMLEERSIRTADLAGPGAEE